MVKSGDLVRYKIGDKSNYVLRGPKYHIPLIDPYYPLNPTDFHFSPDYYILNKYKNLKHASTIK